MKKYFFQKLCLFLLGICCFSCKYYTYGFEEFLYRSGTVDKRADSVVELSGSEVPAFSDSKIVNILVITDIHFGAEANSDSRNRLSSKLLNYLKNLPEAAKPLFCVCLGDITEHGLKSEYKDYNKFVDKLFQLGIKTYSVLGNHDLYNSGWKSFNELVFPYTSFYYFKTDVFSYYFIDSASGSLGKKQMNKLKELLIKDINPKLIFTHIPAYANGYLYFSMQNTEERNLLISMFAKNNVKALCNGHTHDLQVSNLGRFMEYTFPGFWEYKQFGIISVNQNDYSVLYKIIDLNKE